VDKASILVLAIENKWIFC